MTGIFPDISQHSAAAILATRVKPIASSTQMSRFGDDEEASDDGEDDDPAQRISEQFSPDLFAEELGGSLSDSNNIDLITLKNDDLNKLDDDETESDSSTLGYIEATQKQTAGIIRKSKANASVSVIPKTKEDESTETKSRSKITKQTSLMPNSKMTRNQWGPLIL